jgi:hypothetical protein
MLPGTTQFVAEGLAQFSQQRIGDADIIFLAAGESRRINGNAPGRSRAERAQSSFGPLGIALRSKESAATAFREAVGGVCIILEEAHFSFGVL